MILSLMFITLIGFGQTHLMETDNFTIFIYDDTYEGFRDGEYTINIELYNGAIILDDVNYNKFLKALDDARVNCESVTKCDARFIYNNDSEFSFNVNLYLTINDYGIELCTDKLQSYFNDEIVHDELSVVLSYEELDVFLYVISNRNYNHSK